MRRAPFHQPKQVLIFNGAYGLVAIARSIRAAAEVTNCNPQAISLVCNGKYISAGALYFRHLDDNIEVDLTDLAELTLKEYDKLCNAVRKYHSVRDMARRRRIVKDRNKSNQNIDEYEQAKQ